MSNLIFVYNADSGVLNALKDWAHKIVSPQTYACSLCALTYDNLGMRRPLREFIQVLGYEFEFIYRDELADKHGIQDASLPAAFLLQDGELRLWIKSEVLDALQSLDELQDIVTQQLAQGIG
jgi:hypothetical protein